MKKKDILNKVYMQYNFYTLGLRAKNDNETPVIKKVAVLGDMNSGKTSIFSRALNIEEKKFEALLKKGIHKSRFEEVIKFQRGTDPNKKFGMQMIEVNPRDLMTVTGSGLFQLSAVALLIYNLAEPGTIKVLRKLIETLYSWNPKVYTILIGTHKDLPRKVP